MNVTSLASASSAAAQVQRSLMADTSLTLLGGNTADLKWPPWHDFRCARVPWTHLSMRSELKGSGSAITSTLRQPSQSSQFIEPWSFKIGITSGDGDPQ